MSNIFEELDKLINGKSINEAEETVKTEEKPIKKIPINPEMETAEQGVEKALEKIVKYFYKLHMGGMPGMPQSEKNDIDLPDDFLDPKMKGKISGKMEDKEFERNKVLWDEKQEEKLEKEIDVNMTGEDDEFDDFDYRNNEFGDDDADNSELDTSEMEGGSGGGSSDDSEKSEQEKLQDAINDAIDKLRDDKSGSNSQQGGQDGGSQGGEQQDGGQDGGSQSGGSQDGGQQSGGQQGGQDGGSQDGGSQSGSIGSGGQTNKDKMLSDLKDSLARGDKDGVSDTVDRMKEGEDGSGNLAGEHIGKVSDKDIESDMKKAGLSDEDVNEMSQMSDKDTTKEMSEDEMRQLKKEVIDGLNKKCEKRGGSALAKTVVRNALRSKINDDEWRKMLKLFLKSKAVMNGDMAKAKNRIKYGHKNHLWRDAVLPTKTNGRGQIQNIYCFVDFSGSVDQDLVYTFLGRVIDLCSELNYTNVVVYGFGERIVLPREINSRMLKTKGKDVVLSQTWDYISSQVPGGCTENFEDVSNEILEIKKKQRDAVYLIFGDAFWGDSTRGPMCLKEICGERLLDRMCVLTYYMPGNEKMFAEYIAILKEMVGLKNVITTKAESIRKD